MLDKLCNRIIIVSSGNVVALQTWYLLREVLVVLVTDRLERLERFSSISTSELVAELTVDTETLPLSPLVLQSLISDFLNQLNIKIRQ